LKLTLHSQEGLCYLMAAAAAATAGSAATEGRGRGLGGGSVAAAVGGGKHGKLDAGLLAGAFGTSNFLLLVNNNLLEAGLALLTKVFVDGHSGYP
jgi:hypothetical protein